MPVPAGFVFNPSDQDLLWYYLAPKVLGRRIPDKAAVKETDIYHVDPDRLTINTRSSDGKWDYFFVRRDLSEKSRRTPNGFWKEVGEVETINAEFLGGIIGFKRSFVFVEGTEDDPGAITRWEMAEYRLNQERHLLRNDDNPERNNYVACRVYLENEPISECTVDSACRQDAEEEEDDDDNENTEVDSSGVRK
ncbi:unnamed protein product [Musa acuminata subsp. burmannicoides]